MNQRFAALQRLGEQFEHRAPAVPHTATPRRRRLWAALSVGGVALAAAVVALIALLSSGTTPAFANWTAVPTTATPVAVSAAISRCYGVSSSSKAVGRQVLTETRGHSTAVISVKDGTVFMCRYFSAGTQITKNSMGPARPAPSPSKISTPYQTRGGSGSGKLPKSLAARLRHRPLTKATQLALRRFQEGDGYGYYALGRVGPDVTSVSFAFAGHPKVSATVQNGWYFAWWPWTSDPTSTTVSSGATRTSSKMKSSTPESGPSPACQPGTHGCVFAKTTTTSHGSAASTERPALTAAQECKAQSLISPAFPANAFTGPLALSQVHGMYSALIQVTNQKLYGCFVGGNQTNKHGFFALSDAVFGHVHPAPPTGHITVPYRRQTGSTSARGISLIAQRGSGPVRAIALQQPPQGAGYGPSIVGQAAPNVTGVTVLFANGKRIAATVMNGWYLAWWPWISKPISMTVTTSTGNQTSPVTSNPPRSEIVPGCQPGTNDCIFAQPSP